MVELVLQRKLDSLRRCIERVEEKRPASAEVLASDPDVQDIVVLNLSRAVQLCVDMATHVLSTTGAPVPETMGEAFRQMATRHLLDADLAERMTKAVGVRNIAVHSYERINWAIVHAIATRHLDDFRAFATAVVETTDPLP
jgi:uncharacterized protein YutE (UPF0331/DUF86 family)